MINIVLQKDYQHVLKVLRQALEGEGYLLINESETAGAVKIIKRRTFDDTGFLSERVNDWVNTTRKERSGCLYRAFLQEVEKPLFESVLRQAEGNQCKAAKLLGINRNTLHAKIKKLGIRLPKFRA